MIEHILHDNTKIFIFFVFVHFAVDLPVIIFSSRRASNSYSNLK